MIRWGSPPRGKRKADTPTVGGMGRDVRGVVVLGERYDGRGVLCRELKRAWRRVVGEENNPLRAVC